uniref:alpha-L-fucosidase n=1 Tax=Panagrellus redivivus TaxID=6233 RepID=A0A7E4VX99_PANRE
MKSLALLIFAFTAGVVATNYTPNWNSLDSRPLPLCSRYGSEWIWWKWRNHSQSDVVEYLDKHFHGQSYAEFAPQFTAEHLDPDGFADIVAASGAKYFVLTSKHHEGYTLWPSATSFQWNAVDVGPKRDLVATLKTAFKKTDVHYGLYFSHLDWYHPLYISDDKLNRTDFVDLHELVNQYEPDIIWCDGEWERRDTYLKSKEFLVWLYNESPVKDKIVVNDRWGEDTLGKHGGFLTHYDHFHPGQLQPRKWEDAMSLDKHSWGYRQNMKASDVFTVKEVLLKLARAISCNGNLLLNFGPNRYGQIVPIFEERLRSIGNFIKPNSVAIYGTKAWIHQNDGDNVWYTSSVRNDHGLDPRRIFNPQDQENTIIYAWIFDIPDNGTVNLPSVGQTDKTKVAILATGTAVNHGSIGKGITVDLHALPLKKLPSTDVIILKIEYATSLYNPLAPQVTFTIV